MSKKLSSFASLLALLLCLGATAFGQETTGSIEGSIKDPNGAVVPGVQLTITSRGRTETSGPDATTGFTRTITADENGFFRVQQVPPGYYTITSAEAAGFGGVTVNNVEVVLGKTTPVNVTVAAAGQNVTVDVLATDSVSIDPTDNTIQANITQRTAELLPKGVNFTSLLSIAPAVRNEPLSGGFQIDGASGSENTFIIDGQEVTNFRTGTLNLNNNIPFQFVQEVQIKSSGFDAEFGGATGGVITVATRGGSNEFRGDFGMEFRPSNFQGTPRPFLRLTNVPASTALGITASSTVERLSLRKDDGTDFFPTLSLGGPIIKDRAWFFGSYAPQILNTRRTIDYTSFDPRTRGVVASQTYTGSQKNQYAFGRIDLQPFNNLRMTGTYLWNPIEILGTPPAQTTFLDTTRTSTGAFLPTLPGITFPGTGRVEGAAYLDNVGGRQTSNNTTGSIVWTPTEKLTLTARGGYSFLNEKIGNYGIPGVVGQTRQLVQVTGSAAINQAPSNFGLSTGTQNFPGFSQLLFDVSRRRTFDADASYLVNNLVGRHQFKGGVQFNGISNSIQSTLVDTVVYRFGLTIGSVSGLGASRVPSTPGAIGAGFLQRFGAQGSAGSDNLAFYIQDSWQPISRLTLNLGVRTERENSPSFNALGDGITFDFADKIAPRLGFALDLFGDGNTKIFGSYGQFFDRFKYELPRGSFGGNFFRNDYFEIFPGQTIANFNRQTIIGGNGDPIGGTCPIPGSQGLSRCQRDFRIPSNLPGMPDFGQVDPDIEAFRQSEFTVGVERGIGRDFLFRGRYTHKQVDVAVEDVGILTADGGEAYIIGNPGRGTVAEISQANGFALLDAVRDYDALEVSLDKRFVNNFYFNTSYTYSRLFGNYAGLASSDEAAGGTGRTSPNVNRNFDLPFIGFSGLGQPDNGRLATDRPHAFKFSGAYEQKWSATNSTEVSGFTQIASGTPVTTRYTLFGVGGQILNGRGDLGRTETFTQTDFGVRHRYRFGNDGRVSIIMNLDILNLFDEQNELGRFETISSTGINLDAGDLALTNPALSAFDQELQGIRIYQTRAVNEPIGAFFRANNLLDPRFNQPNLFQGPRSVRFGFRLQF